MMRFNPHWHCIILEGGIDEKGFFHHIPIKDTSQLTEVFRKRVIQLFVEKGLLQKSFAQKLLGWKHSGFSVDNSVGIPASSQKARVNLSQYIIRHPVSLKKIMYIKEKGNIIYHTKYNGYWKENIKLLKAADFINISPQSINISSGTTGFIPAERRVRPPKTGALPSAGTMPHPQSNLLVPLILRWRLYHLKLQKKAGHD